ncbi:MAG TPA: DUF2281 domain-containing protein [Blastocatellia bacterium]|nr:DUF2281 domain-containing protein [Blastocatellia bacterium]
MKSLDDKVRELPPELQQEVESFIESLSDRMKSKDAVQLRLDWRGALQELSAEYSSVDLQHKALDWWKE